MQSNLMKTDNNHFANVLLTGTILLANIDMNGILDYGLKAFVGGTVWLGFKLTADYLDRKRKGASK